jgi:hypothetical protein
MSLFQQLWSRISWSRVHHAACAGSVNFFFPATAPSTSPTEWMPCAPIVA